MEDIKKEIVEEVVDKSPEEIENELIDEIFTEEMKAQEDEYNKLVSERDEYKNKYLYTLAEMDNIKKRFANERPKLISNAVGSAVSKVFTIIDDFERAVKSNETNEDIASLRDGYSVLYDKFINILDNLGVKKINTDGVDFDTDYHEAVAMVPVDENKKNKVIECIQTGYTYNDGVIRHAKVVVGSVAE